MRGCRVVVGGGADGAAHRDERLVHLARTTPPTSRAPRGAPRRRCRPTSSCSRATRQRRSTTTSSSSDSTAVSEATTSRAQVEVDGVGERAHDSRSSSTASEDAARSSTCGDVGLEEVERVGQAGQRRLDRRRGSQPVGPRLRERRRRCAVPAVEQPATSSAARERVAVREDAAVRRTSATDAWNSGVMNWIVMTPRCPARTALNGAEMQSVDEGSGYPFLMRRRPTIALAHPHRGPRPRPRLRGPGRAGAGAPGARGAQREQDWAEADKAGFGTAHGRKSRVWFTLESGRVSEVFYPDLSTPSIRMLELMVVDGQHATARPGT